MYLRWDPSSSKSPWLWDQYTNVPLGTWLDINCHPLLNEGYQLTFDITGSNIHLTAPRSTEGFDDQALWLYKYIFIKKRKMFLGTMISISVDLIFVNNISSAQWVKFWGKIRDIWVLFFCLRIVYLGGWNLNQGGSRWFKPFFGVF